MSESINDETNPHDCITFLNTWEITKYGVLRVAELFSGKSKKNFAVVELTFLSNQTRPLRLEIFL